MISKYFRFNVDHLPQPKQGRKNRRTGAGREPELGESDHTERRDQTSTAADMKTQRDRELQVRFCFICSPERLNVLDSPKTSRVRLSSEESTDVRVRETAPTSPPTPPSHTRVVTTNSAGAKGSRGGVSGGFINKDCGRKDGKRQCLVTSLSHLRQPELRLLNHL